MKIKKTESRLHCYGPLGRFVSALVMVALWGIVLPAFAQQGYEAPPVLAPIVMSISQSPEMDPPKVIEPTHLKS